MIIKVIFKKYLLLKRPRNVADPIEINWGRAIFDEESTEKE